MSHADDVLAHPELLDGGVIDKDANLDELQLRAQGHVSELPRRFSMFSLLAFSFSIMNSWTGIVPLLITDLTLGGPSATFWTPLVACLASSLIGLGLAELASAFPSSGGQYQYVTLCLLFTSFANMQKLCILSHATETSICCGFCDCLVQHLCVFDCCYIRNHYSSSGHGRADPDLSPEL